MNERLNEGDVSRVETLHAKCAEIRRELAKRVVGQEEMVDQVLTAVFARGHALLTGVPGLAKTLLVRTLAEVMDLGFGRIQFTPDLMPADVTGTEVLDEDRATGRHVFRFVNGPVFTNLLLADEINRTPPKTQAALLEAMQEHCVTVGGETRPLPEPFFVLATQNPIEQEGTYPLPESARRPARTAPRPPRCFRRRRLSSSSRSCAAYPPPTTSWSTPPTWCARPVRRRPRRRSS